MQIRTPAIFLRSNRQLSNGALFWPTGGKIRKFDNRSFCRHMRDFDVHYPSATQSACADNQVPGQAATLRLEHSLSRSEG